MVLIFFCIFKLTEQWESPCYQTIKQYEVFGLGIVPCFQTLKQYQVAGLGMLLILIFLFLSPHYQSRRVIKIETISSCWFWYATDIYLPFLSPHYQSRLVIRIWNNIKLLDLVWYWFFSAFLFSTDNESHLLIRHWNNIKLLDLVCYWCFFSFFYRPTLRVAMLL